MRESMRRSFQVSDIIKTLFQAVFGHTNELLFLCKEGPKFKESQPKTSLLLVI